MFNETNCLKNQYEVVNNSKIMIILKYLYKRNLLAAIFFIGSLIYGNASVLIDGLYYNLNDETKSAEVTSKTEQNFSYVYGEIVVPSTVNYGDEVYNVVCIGDSAFYSCRYLTSIDMPKSLTEIGNSAFDGCESLASVTMPNSVTLIGKFAFNGCRGLTSVDIPNSVTEIGWAAFSRCSSLVSINIPNSVTQLGAGAFIECTSLTSVTLPNSLQTIEESLFYGCSSLISVTIPPSVTKIGKKAFIECSSLTSVTIPNAVTEIGEFAFFHCSSLTSVTLPNSLGTIEEALFSGCSSLVSVNIPNSVTEIGKRAFEGCESLTSLIIGNSVTLIGMTAFNWCSSLTSVYSLSQTPPEIDTSGFFECRSSCVLYVPSESISLYKNQYPWKNFYIIRAIGDEIEPNISVDFNDDVLTVAVEGAEEPITISLYSVWGQCVLRQTIDTNMSVTEQIDLTNLAKGAYVVQVVSGEMNATQRIVK